MGVPSRLGQVHGPVNGLSVGGLLGASCQKQGEWRVSCTDTFTQLDLDILVRNNIVIDCVFFSVF